jgi:hypothetical protein
LLEPDLVKRNDVSTKIDADVLEDCRIAAAFRGVSLAEYLSETMRAAARRDIDEAYARRSAGKGKPDHRPKGKGGGA